MLGLITVTIILSSPSLYHFATICCQTKCQDEKHPGSSFTKWGGGAHPFFPGVHVCLASVLTNCFFVLSHLFCCVSNNKLCTCFFFFAAPPPQEKMRSTTWTWGLLVGGSSMPFAKCVYSSQVILLLNVVTSEGLNTWIISLSCCIGHTSGFCDSCSHCCNGL